MGIIYDLTKGSEDVEDLDTLLQKEKYLSYIFEHQRNVLAAYIKLFNPKNVDILKNKGIVNDTILEELSQEIINHDNSKFSNEEFDFYRKKFYPTNREKKLSISGDEMKQFDIAWMHHYLNNPHHPQYWKWVQLGSNKNTPNYSNTILPVATPMDIVSILHMICDWEAMSFKFNSTTMDWYNSNASEKERESLNPETKEKLEEILNILYR